MRKLTMISLYTGAGGLDYGFEAAGFDTAIAVERDAQCCHTLAENRRWPVIEGDIADVSSKAILTTGGVQAGHVDMLIGGPPCQPFSKAGYWASGDAKRLDDPRANTLAEYMRVLEETRPRAFLLENVPGLKFNGKDEGLVYLQQRLARINKQQGCNYSMEVQQLRAADFGVPQRRERVFVIGARDGTPFEFPSPTHIDTEKLTPQELTACTRTPYLTAWDALGDDKPDDLDRLSMTGKYADLLPSIPAGENYLYHTDRGGGVPLFGWRRRYWSFLLKLAPNKPSWTIQAQPGPAIGPFHWDNRRLGEQELRRLQTFPQDITVHGNLRSVQKQLGNAVPSLLAEVLARQVRCQLLGESRLRRPLKLLPPLREPPRRGRRPMSVPTKYLTTLGVHDAHPGTGLGYGAQRRVASAGV